MFVPYFTETLVQFFVTSFFLTPLQGLVQPFLSLSTSHLVTPKRVFSQEPLTGNFLLSDSIDFVPWKAARPCRTYILTASH